MLVIADLQLHSKFSRAVSKDMAIPYIASWASRKGIDLVATGDWTHPLWMREIESTLEETGNGLLRLKSDAEVAPTFSAHPSSLGSLRVAGAGGPPRRGPFVGVLGGKPPTGPAGSNLRLTVLEKGGLPALSPLFMLATEISCIYSQGGKVRRIHILIWVPTMAAANKIAKEMTRRGCNLMSDGRPIIGLSSIQLSELVLSLEPQALIIPAHAWTPWFSVYGGMSGFDSLEEAFGPFTRQVYAVETGLSSSPAMNWRIKELDQRTIVSFSDAHSGPKIGREATAFEISEDKLSYQAIYQAIQGDQAKNSRIVYTIEFYPEEGKYHYTGHRSCNVRLTPLEAKAKGTTCPVCGKPLTQGVMQRVEELAGRSEEELQLSSVKVQASGIDAGVRMIGSKTFPHRPPFVMLVPLQEIIAEAVGAPVVSPKVQPVYFRLTEALGGEFGVLLKAKTAEIAKFAGERIAAGVDKVRRGEIVIEPGYDGVFGVVKIWQAGEEKPLLDANKEQLSIF